MSESINNFRLYWVFPAWFALIQGNFWNETVVRVVNLCPPGNLRFHHRVISSHRCLFLLELLYFCNTLLDFLSGANILQLWVCQLSFIQVDLVVDIFDKVIANSFNNFLITRTASSLCDLIQKIIEIGKFSYFSLLLRLNILNYGEHLVQCLQSSLFDLLPHNFITLTIYFNQMVFT